MDQTDGQREEKPKGKKASDGKIKSSSALEYLMQRESQITNMLKGLEEDGEVAPDKKL